LTTIRPIPTIHTIRYSQLFTIRYSGFPDTPGLSPNIKFAGTHLYT